MVSEMGAESDPYFASIIATSKRTRSAWHSAPICSLPSSHLLKKTKKGTQVFIFVATYLEKNTSRKTPWKTGHPEKKFPALQNRAPLFF